MFADFQFAWDPGKASRNLRKHGISFETAARVFVDPFAITEQDRIEGGEQRWRTLGLAAGWLVLVVAHTIQVDDGGEVIRIISARRAEPKERRRYEHENR